jgi:hypothetical protein
MSLFDFIFNLVSEYPVVVIGFLLAVVYIILSFHKIGPTEVGLVTKRFSFADRREVEGRLRLQD